MALYYFRRHVDKVSSRLLGKKRKYDCVVCFCSTRDLLVTAFGAIDVGVTKKKKDCTSGGLATFCKKPWLRKLYKHSCARMRGVHLAAPVWGRRLICGHETHSRLIAPRSWSFAM